MAVDLRGSEVGQRGASGLENPVVTWLVIIGVISISGLGMYGGRSESALPLKIFAGCVGVGLIIMLIFAIIGITQRRQIQDAVHSGSIHMTKEQAALLDQIYQISIAVHFGLSVVAGLSLGMSISMIRQIQRYDSREPVTFSA
ncbi:hypothetical protein INR49_019762 [Caranx melampygus]|nr:hypothetical protein INR49_019762 [Caranx melampygus]